MVLGGDDLRAGREIGLGPAGTGQPYAVAGADLLVSRDVHGDRLVDAAGGSATLAGGGGPDRVWRATTEGRQSACQGGGGRARGDSETS